MTGYDFERMLVTLLAEVIDSKGLDHKPIANQAWPHKKDAATRWRGIRNGKGEKIPGLLIRDAVDLCNAIGVSFVEICGRTVDRLSRKKE